MSNDSGVVEVEWDVVRTGTRGELTFNWRERHGPTVAAPAKTSFGTQLIKRLLVSEAGGVADISYDPSGVSFIAKVPID